MNDTTSIRAPKKETPQSAQSIFLEMMGFLIITAAIVVPLRLFIAQPFIVSGESMVPTFENKDYLIIDEISYRIRDPRRGDVIVFRYPLQPDRFFIKRVIGLPGERIVIKNSTITVSDAEAVTSFSLDESFLVDTQTLGETDLTLKEGEYFVMGDNRNESSDSREWGPLDEKYIMGRAWLRLFPFQDIDFLPGAHHFEEVSS